MPVIQTFDKSFASSVGRTGISDSVYAELLSRSEDSLARLQKAYADQSLPFLHMPEATRDMEEFQAAVQPYLRGARHVIVLGTGGSSLGGQALAQLADYNIAGLGALENSPRLHFFDNLDPDTFERFLDYIPLESSRFIVVSKSGGTAETLVQTIAVLSALKRSGLSEKATSLILGLSEPRRKKPNALRDLLEPLGVAFLDHHTGVGGRFSVLTNVGLLPAFIAGLDVAAIRLGAWEALQAVLNAPSVDTVPSACGAALNLAAAQCGKNIAVMLAYADKFERFTAWWVQLWAESLGKNGLGTTPVRNIGPVDQHSQLQLHLAGPRDKFFTVLTVGTRHTGALLDATQCAQAGLDIFAGRTIGDLVSAQGQATIDTLARNGCPVRHFHTEKLNEKSLGYLLMHFMLETVIAADLMGIDAYDQPAVEEGKVLAREYVKALPL